METCICSKVRLSALMIKCKEKSCTSPWWHTTCAGLRGLTEEGSKGVKFICPLCAISKMASKDKIMIEKPTGECNLSQVSPSTGEFSMAELKDSIIKELKESLNALLTKEICNQPKQSDNVMNSPW